MRQIGKGWQYKVYDLDNGRVRKIKYSALSRYFLISSQLWRDSTFPFREAHSELKRTDLAEKQSNTYIQSILPVLDKEIIGNIIFISASDYEQDKVLVLEHFLKDCSVEQGKEVVNKYIQCIHKTWEFGFSDSVYNFTINNGLNSMGNVIQIDFGELVFSKDEVIKRITAKRWLRSASYLCFPEGELKEFYRTAMEIHMNTNTLDIVWSRQLAWKGR